MPQPPRRTSIQDTVSLLIYAPDGGETDSSNLPEIIPKGYLQNPGCDLLAIMLTLPHIHKPTMGHWCLRWVITEWGFQRSWKQGLAATNIV